MTKKTYSQYGSQKGFSWSFQLFLLRIHRENPFHRCPQILAQVVSIILKHLWKKSTVKMPMFLHYFVCMYVCILNNRKRQKNHLVIHKFIGVEKIRSYKYIFKESVILGCIFVFVTVLPIKYFFFFCGIQKSWKSLKLCSW